MHSEEATRIDLHGRRLTRKPGTVTGEPQTPKTLLQYTVAQSSADGHPFGPHQDLRA